MLGDRRPIAFVATTDAARAREFYEHVLGLRLIEDGEFAITFALGDITLRIQKAGPFEPHPFTALGWEVADIHATVRALNARGVKTVRYDYIPADDLGIWDAGSALVTWFHDPDRNVLSLTQYKR